MDNLYTCRKCGADFEDWNVTEFTSIRFCPSCGQRLLKEQTEALRRKATNEEIGDRIRSQLLDLLSCCGSGDISADELCSKAWESENCDGAVFYCNNTADRFAMRHSRWVDKAMEYAADSFGDAGYYAKMRSGCTDRFLAAAFIFAAEHYVFGQLEIDREEGDLSKRRIKEIIRLIKSTPYDGGF